MKNSIVEENLSKIVKKARQDDSIKGVILYGSYLTERTYNDMDLALIVSSHINTSCMSKIRLRYFAMFLDVFDVQIFQQLPLSLQKEILNGKALYETPEMYNLAYQVIKSYNNIKPYIEDYIEVALSEN